MLKDRRPNDRRDLLQFGPFRLDGAERQLFRGGDPVPLTAKAFDVLQLLIDHRDRTVTKEEFMETVWAGTVVEEANLTDNISTLRQALGDDAREPHYIRTVPKRGYRFVAEVSSGVAGFSLPETVPSGGLRPGARRTMVGGVVLTLVVLAALAWVMRPRTNAPQTIAVLPFKPLAGGDRDPAMEMGMTDALIAKLSRIDELRVRPTTAVMPYANTSAGIREIANKLDVETILEGKLQKGGDRMRVSVQLVRASDGATIWADRFDERFTDIFALQDAISERVATALQVRLSRDERQSLEKRATENVEAYQLYLNGKHQWRMFDPDALLASINYYNAALELDPGFALAWAGLADTYGVIAIWGPLPAGEAFPKSLAAARKAAALDPMSPEAHVSLLANKLLYERDWAGALGEMDKLEQLDPASGELHMLRAYYQQAMGRSDLALAEFERARNITPDWHVSTHDYLDGLVEARRFDQAILECRRVIALDERRNTPYAILGAALAAAGRYDEAIAPLERAVAGVSTSRARHVATLAWAHAKAGRREKALALIEEMKVDPHPWAAFSVARASTALGDHDQVFYWLNRAADQKFGFLFDVRNRHEFDSIRQDPRYAQLLARMRL